MTKREPAGKLQLRPAIFFMIFVCIFFEVFRGFSMNDFMINLLNLCWVPFSSTDNLIIYIPTLSLTVCFVLSLFRYMLYRGF